MPDSPSLLEELGLDEETLAWQHLAACRGMSLSFFFEDYEDDKELAKAMDEVCLGCPVMKDCLMSGYEKKDYGLRGAIFLNNGRPDSQHNKHKTDEVWSRIRERIK